MFLAAVRIVEPNQKLPRCLLTKEQLNKAVSSSDKMLLSDEKGLPVGTSNTGGSQKYDAGRKKPFLRTTCCVIALIRHSSYVLVTQLGPTLCDPTSLLRPWDSPGKDTSGLPLPSLGHLPNPGIQPGSPALQTDSLPSEPPGKPYMTF